MAEKKEKNGPNPEPAPEGNPVQLACEAYGIDPKHVFASGIDRETGVVTIVTAGGKKVRWNGEKVEKLSAIEITGINPVKRKPVMGKGVKR